MLRGKSKILCRSCDLVVQLPPARLGCRYLCPQCGTQLRSKGSTSLYNLAVISIASVIMLLTSLTLPFMSISSFGISQSMSLTSIFFILRRDWAILLYLCILFTFLFPLVLHCIVIAVVFLRVKVTPTLANIYMVCFHFCMVDVFILGVLVSLVKLIALADVEFHVGFYTAIGFAILMVWCCAHGKPYKIWNLIEGYESDLKYAHVGMRGIDQGLIWCRHCGLVYRRTTRRRRAQSELAPSDPRYLYQGIQACPRCHHHNDYREVACYQKTIALLLAALILYVPSNMYPIMVTSYLGTDTESNIIDGVISLWGMGSYFVALVILVASICIPVVKILCILWLLFVAHHGTRRSPSTYNRLYRVVLFIGRWSMIDVFVVIIMSTVVRMSGLLTISPGFAVICFSMVVLITMVAAETFDERLLWDATLSARHGTVGNYTQKMAHHSLTTQEQLAQESTGQSAAPPQAANMASATSAADVDTPAANAAKEANATEKASTGAWQEAAAAAAESYKVLRTVDLLQRVQLQGATVAATAATTAVPAASATPAAKETSPEVPAESQSQSVVAKPQAEASQGQKHS